MYNREYDELLDCYIRKNADERKKLKEIKGKKIGIIHILLS
jgi:hypothetical protein